MKNIIITGAAGNLGKTVTQYLLDEGYNIEATLGSHDSEDFIVHDKLSSQHLNLLDEDKVEEYVKEVHAKHDTIDAAVLLVGGFMPGGFKQTTKKDLERMYKLNFETAFFLVKPLLEIFEKQAEGGKFIFIGTRPALNPKEGKNLIAYSLSKTLLFRLAEIVNAYGEDKQIQASVIVPSTMDTPGTRSAMPDADFEKWVPTKNVAETIAFLLSETGGMLRDTIVKIYNRS
ncbi:MAG: SDR family NAD(P)-dependent oxidoreductase [Bacteroidota bacterium]